MPPAKSSSKSASKPAGKSGRDREAIRIRWDTRNKTLFIGGLGAVLLGYVLLARGDVTLAPLLLVGGYCVLIPLAFIL